MLQNTIACFQELHFSFVQLDVLYLFYCGVSLPEAELIIGY
jgi:hypothetical protein